MKKLLIITASTMLVAGGSMAASGEELFMQHCTVCHPNGGNVIKPNRTLHKKVLAREGVKDADGIVKLMRNPGEGMTRFETMDISDQDAKSIADYILKTF